MKRRLGTRQPLGLTEHPEVVRRWRQVGVIGVEHEQDHGDAARVPTRRSARAECHKVKPQLPCRVDLYGIPSAAWS